MLMRDIEIKQGVASGTIQITPFRSERLQGASYDLSVGAEAFVSGSEDKVVLGPASAIGIHMEPWDFALVVTMESVKLPLDVACVIGMRSSLARKGLMLLSGLQIDPGFEGHLRFGLYNSSPRKMSLFYDDELCTIEFHRLSGPVEHPPPRIPELIAGKIPKEDRAYLSSLETTSLSELSRNVQSMSRSVETLTSQVRWINIIVIPAVIAILLTVVGALINSLLR